MLVSRSRLIFSLILATILTGCSSTAPRNNFVGSTRPLPEPTLPNPELGKASDVIPDLPTPVAPAESEVKLASADEPPVAEPVVQVNFDANEDASAPELDPAFGQLADEESVTEASQTAALAPAAAEKTPKTAEEDVEVVADEQAAPEPEAEWAASQGRVPVWAASGWKSSGAEETSDSWSEQASAEESEADLPPELPDFEAPLTEASTPEKAAASHEPSTEATADADEEWALPVAAESQSDDAVEPASPSEADSVSHRMAILAYEVGNESNPDQATLETLRSLLEHESNHVRLNSAEALFKLGHGSEQSLAVIQHTLSSSDENLAFLATIALGSVYQHSPGEALDLLLKQFVQNSEAVQRQAVLMVGEYQENRDELVPILTRVADKHPNADVREAAVLSLSCLNQK
ncbi:HEAT repeat domain-containing protein [Rubinisphaera margarita]|uniref:HEAT repeat domain-containing protein n=1 Tax=Rubinisphaera margarita TaxID=2909586 RepID=UPI001EE93A9F|nr:HEAT repeat domain-containing protein [Rubinisphaera margarita]MCG6157278.1 hypothetical protein [Rubinisphaera margarita]